MEPITADAYSDLQRRYQRWAEIEADSVSPLYAEWARGIAGDASLLTHVAELEGGKRQPNLVFASARMAGVPLAPWTAVRDDFETKWSAIRASVISRGTQTNEPLRMATLLPAIGDVAGTIALVEVGASAGLCLYPDRWRYRFGPGRYLGVSERPLLETDASASVPIPRELPRITWRGGVDLQPLSPSDAETKDWLEALIWPDAHGRVDGERVDRLRTGIAIARREPAHVVAGDLRTESRAVIEEAARHADRVVVWHSAVLAYLGASDRAEFMEVMRELDVTWISNEGRSVVPGEEAPWESPGDFVLRRDGIPLAATHPHGRSITWRDDLV